MTYSDTHSATEETVSAAEANRHFSRLVREGRSYAVTAHGRLAAGCCRRPKRFPRNDGFAKRRSASFSIAWQSTR